MTKITHVAIMFDGKIWSLPAPNRHHNVIRLIRDATGKGIDGPDIQGFLDEDGVFLNRHGAFLRAQKTGQLDRSRHPPNSYNGNELYSEDLW